MIPGWIRSVLLVVVAVAAHVLLGWAWSAVAGLLAGATARRRFALAGALVVGSGWGLLVAYNLAVAQFEVNQYFRFLSQTANVPAALVPIVSIALGALIGGVSGWFGNSVVHVARSVSASKDGGYR